MADVVVKLRRLRANEEGVGGGFNVWPSSALCATALAGVERLATAS